MGRSVNKVTLIGTLGRDPEVRYLPNGNAVANINLATDESYNDKQTGQKVERTEWHRLTVYGRLAEIAQQYLHKGSRAYFEGKLQTREWEKDGIKRYTTEIVVNELMMLDRPSDGSYQAAAPAGPAAMPNQSNQFGGYPAQAAAQQQSQNYGQPQYQQPAAQPQNQGYSGYGAQPAPAQRPAAPQPAPMQAVPPMQPAAAHITPMPPQAAPQPLAGNSFDNNFDDDIPF